MLWLPIMIGLHGPMGWNTTRVPDITVSLTVQNNSYGLEIN